MNAIPEKVGETLDGGIREVLAAADAREAKANTIPPSQRPVTQPVMTKVPVTPADISMKTMENTMNEKVQIDAAIKDKQALVQKISREIEQAYADLYHHMTELGQLQHHSTVLALQGLAHAHGAQLAKGKQ
jgi:hypothetical protein